MNDTATLQPIEHDDILEIRLNRPPVNAMNPQLVSDLDAAIRDGADRAGLVISGREGLFSAGLDVPALLELDRDGMRDFWHRFFGLLETVAASEAPIAMAITGHSPAGGAVLSLFGDTRIMSRGDYRIGLNETQVGLVVPMPIQRALQRVVGPHRAERLLVAGAMLGPEQAFAVGLVDELADDPAATVSAAVDWCRGHAQLPQHAMRATRRMARADLSALFEDRDALGIDAFVEGWFEEQTQATLHALVAALKKR